MDFVVYIDLAIFGLSFLPSSANAPNPHPPPPSTLEPAMTDDPEASDSSHSADTSQEVAIELPSRNHFADWDIITTLMKRSRLPGLDLKDIIHILYQQEAHVKHIEFCCTHRSAGVVSEHSDSTSTRES